MAFGRLSQSRGGTPIDVCLPMRARSCPKAWQNTHCVCRRFASDIFFRSFPFVPFVIRAEAALANASTGICLLQFSMDHRVKPGGDDLESVVTVDSHSSGAQPRREDGFT